MRRFLRSGFYQQRNIAIPKHVMYPGLIKTLEDHIKKLDAEYEKVNDAKAKGEVRRPHCEARLASSIAFVKI